MLINTYTVLKYNRLYRDKVLFLGQEIDNDISNQIISILLYLNIENNDNDVNFFINCPGGNIISGMSIFDTMEFIHLNIKTICFGLSSSMGSFILTGGCMKKRLTFLHSRIMIHQPTNSFFEAQTCEFISEAEELLKLRELITLIYSKKIKKSLWVISEDLERDTFMSSNETIIYGIIDLIAL